MSLEDPWNTRVSCPLSDCNGTLWVSAISGGEFKVWHRFRCSGCDREGSWPEFARRWVNRR